RGGGGRGGVRGGGAGGNDPPRSRLTAVTATPDTACWVGARLRRARMAGTRLVTCAAEPNSIGPLLAGSRLLVLFVSEENFRTTSQTPARAFSAVVASRITSWPTTMT